MSENGPPAVRINEHGIYYVGASRVTLDSVILRHQAGDTPERIQQSFPLLGVGEIERAIAYYLAHRYQVEAYLAEQQRQWDEALDQQARDPDPLVRRLCAAQSSKEQPVP